MSVPIRARERREGAQIADNNDGLDPETKSGRYRIACLELLREHDAKGDIPSNGRFVFYELVQRGVVPKKYEGTNPKTGLPWTREPRQDIADALLYLREQELIPWEWLTDVSRDLIEPRYARTVADYLRDTVELARIDLWGGEEPPLYLCEARATADVLRNLAYEFLVPITATGGQCGGFLVTDVVPRLRGKRWVRYIGDSELRGPAEQIEANTRDYIERHADRIFAPGEWTKVALTEAQVNRSSRLRALTITKLDNRYKPPKPYEAIECEALGQSVLVRTIRRDLDNLRRARGLPPIEEVRREEERQRTEMMAALARIAQRRR
jgi:hypothetical protein